MPALDKLWMRILCLYKGHRWIRQYRIPLLGFDRFSTLLEGFRPVGGAEHICTSPYFQCRNCGARRASS